MSKKSEDLEELLNKATQGPWKVRDGFMINELHIAPVKVNGKRKPEIGEWAELAEVPTHYVRRGDGKANATLMALAPSLAAEVLELRKLKAQLAAMTAERDHWHEGWKRAMGEFDLKCKALNAALAERDALVGALTPSAETKVAYMGEFSFPQAYTDDEGDEAFGEVYVPWDTIKQIMAAILAAAQKEAGK